MTEYGLPSRRDNDGNRVATEYAYTWQGEEITIKMLQPTVAEAEQYEELGDDVKPSKMAEIVNKHLVKPEIDADDMTVEELMCYAEGIFSATSESADFAAEVDKELSERATAEGN